jgi:hypothetical protein
MATIGRKIGFATESAEADHAVIVRGIFRWKKAAGSNHQKFSGAP